MWRDSLAVTVKNNNNKKKTRKETFVVLTMEVVKRKVPFLASWGKVLHTMPSLIYN